MKYHSNGTFQQAIIRSIFNREYTKEDLNPIEKYAIKVSEFNITQEDLAVKLGKSEPPLLILRLLNLDKKYKIAN